jgi:protein-S-isoprenylcysteine O-methyltransferase Ste14
MTGKSPPNPVTERPNRIPWPPIILLAAIVAAVLLGELLPILWLPSPIFEMVAVLGVMLGGAAIAMDVTAMQAMRRAKTTILPHKGSDALVTTGPFAITRNPIYLGNVLLLFALGMVLGNPWFFAAALAAGGLTQRLAIIREEAHLKAKFPAGWQAYQKKVRRWL